MATQIIFKNVQTIVGTIVIKALINTAEDLFYFLKECHSKHGISLKFIKEFLSDYFPQLIHKFLDHLINESRKTLIGWLGSLLKLLK